MLFAARQRDTEAGVKNTRRESARVGDASASAEALSPRPGPLVPINIRPLSAAVTVEVEERFKADAIISYLNYCEALK